MEQSKEKVLYLRVRNLCGLLGIILPWLALFSAGIATHPSNEWWWSISATYYQSPALVGVLVPASIVLITYVGYDRTDNLVTSLSGIFGLGIVLFPCHVSWLDDAARVGFFQLPMNVSNVLHTAFAALFFILLAYNSICLFTKSGGELTPRKKMRNKVYRICGWGMIGLEVLFAINVFLPTPGYITMLVEIVLLHLFGISWLVKGEAVKWLNDD
ncbi:MAG: hypothetical protein ACI308_06400 [Muribaculaceae bacterium]